MIGQAVSHIFGCLSGRIGQTVRNLGAILAKLRAAGGDKVLIVGMTYYVPELGLWKSMTGRQRSRSSPRASPPASTSCWPSAYHRYGARVADVFDAFKSADFSTKAGKTSKTSKARPPNVAAICALTWMCAPRPRGPNEHANAAGYHVIAEAFWRAITK